MSVAVVVPLYKPRLDPLEEYSLDHSLEQLSARDLHAVGPDNLDLAYYRSRYPQLLWQPFEQANFDSLQGYNRLLVSPGFYQAFAEYEFVLILQPDAIVLRDDLDLWCAEPYDYIGAPWPGGLAMRMHTGKTADDSQEVVRVFVGNGGLSLRRVSQCLALIEERNHDFFSYFQRTGSNEDLFFAFMGLLSETFRIPDETTASRFAVELMPSYYYHLNGQLPMGAHAWWKSDPEFWRAHLPHAPLPP